MNEPFSHITEQGDAKMVDVGDKMKTHRTAIAEAWVNVGQDIAARLRDTASVDKGNVIETARLAGLMGAKRTSDLIPMCHPLSLEHVELQIKLVGERIHVVSHIKCTGKTGVEMEAMTAVSIAALTIYDMVKSAGKGVEIGPIRLLEKHGGKSGDWFREPSAQ